MKSFYGKFICNAARQKIGGTDENEKWNNLSKMSQNIKAT
jgi:hypothetical protein